MVLEQIVSANWLERRPLFALLLGFIYTLIGSITGFIFFKDSLSISILFLVTLLLVPSLVSMLSIQEEIERKAGLRKFFSNHKDIFEIYLFLSIGIFVGYLLVVWLFGLWGMDLSSTLSEQTKVFGEALTESKINEFTGQGLGHVFGIFSSNLGVALIFFILSFFYGAGSIFLIVWNASIFSTFIVLTLQNVSRGIKHSLGLLGAFSIYIIPEIGGFLLAGIAGGVVSKALVKEKFMGEGFRNVVRDATVLLLFSFVLLLVAAFLESYVGVSMIKMLV